MSTPKTISRSIKMSLQKDTLRLPASCHSSTWWVNLASFGSASHQFLHRSRLVAYGLWIGGWISGRRKQVLPLVSYDDSSDPCCKVEKCGSVPWQTDSFSRTPPSIPPASKRIDNKNWQSSLIETLRSPLLQSLPGAQQNTRNWPVRDALPWSRQRIE